MGDRKRLCVLAEKDILRILIDVFYVCSMYCAIVGMGTALVCYLDIMLRVSLGQMRGQTEKK